MIMTFHIGGARRLSVALLLVALFGLPAVGYSADPSAMVAEGVKAYQAKDYARARTLFDEACTGGNAGGCFVAGKMFRKGEGGAKDLARARALYDQACKGGDAGGCYSAGIMFRKGEGGAQDQARALGCRTLVLRHHRRRPCRDRRTARNEGGEGALPALVLHGARRARVTLTLKTGDDTIWKGRNGIRDGPSLGAESMGDSR